MARQRDEVPACYAMVFPGLEEVAADEITEVVRGEIKRTGRGIVVFRVPEIDAALLKLRTTEDVFLLAWGSDQLTYRAADLDLIERWTARDADWDHLLRIHHEVRPRPKGKPTYHLVTQMTGEHGYRRTDAGKALARGLGGKFPASWRAAEENAAIEVWLTIHGRTAVCGLRLSDRTMRHRRYKVEHLGASLRPTVAAAMVRLAEAHPGHVVLDPMCGAGTLLAEQIEAARLRRQGAVEVVGGDIELSAVRAAAANLRRLVEPRLNRWDAAQMPLADESVDRIVSNPPFGKQMASPEEVGPLYQRVLPEYDRVLRPGGRAVLLASDANALRQAADGLGWRLTRRLPVRVLGQGAFILIWDKPTTGSRVGV